MEKIKILIADDHKIFRDGLKALFEKEKDVVVVAEARNGTETIQKAKEVNPDILLLDIDLGDMSGIEVAEKLKDFDKNINVLTLSMHSDSNYIIKMLEVGAKGYILKNTGKDEMLTAIRTIARGDSYFSNEISAKIVQYIANPKGIHSKMEKLNVPLTNRELEVLRLIAQEYSNTEIAEKLFISIRTVDTHRRNLIEKLQLKNTAGLVKYALKNNIVDN